jgi:hypothetical protein
VRTLGPARPGFQRPGGSPGVELPWRLLLADNYLVVYGFPKPLCRATAASMPKIDIGAALHVQNERA